MSYKCFVTKVQKVIPISNADKIQTAIVLGNQVVVSKNVKVGDLGLFFPADCQLSEDFCKYNNLFRDSSKNINPDVKGFFEDNRRVRCQPFMKVKSEGYFCGIESLDYIFDLNTTKGQFEKVGATQEGVSFDKIKDAEICRKYISLQTQRKLNNQAKNGKKTKQIETPMFNKHVDTDQFDYYVDKIPKGALLSFHAKIHGCFPATQPIMMWDGSKKKIKDIKVGDVIVGHKDGEAVPSKVTNTFDNGRETCWVDLEYDRSKFLGNKVGKVRCTANHRFLTESGEYVEASLLTKGAGLVFNSKSPKPSQSQVGAYLGMLLGDGYLSKSGNLQFCHKEDHKEYVEYKLNNFKCLGSRLDNTVEKVSGYGSKVLFNMLPVNPFLTEMFSKYQQEGKGKILDDEIVNLATKETLAFLYMDDGSLTTTPFQKDRANIAVCGIRDEDIKFIESIFNKFNIFPIYYKDTKGFNRLRFNTKEAYKLFNIIQDYIPLCMQYKLPEEMRKDNPILKYCEPSVDGVFTCIRKLTKNPSTTIDTKRKGHKYDIETETHNYVAGEVTVHNSSARMTYTKVVKQPEGIKETINNILGKKLFKPAETWEYVVGTRNVILYSDQSDKEGFHGSEQFRFDAMEQVKPFLDKGMTIYGELSGYANGSPIMGRHDVTKLKDKKYTKKYGDVIEYSYGCKENETRLDIYRISYTNEDGVELDLTYPQMKSWCESKGLNCSMEVSDSYIYTGTDHAKKKLIERMELLADRPECLSEDYYDSSHINEGVILRVDYQGQVPKFYKKKSYAFRVLEGIFKESNVDLEDAS